jgi:hypothetical protein
MSSMPNEVKSDHDGKFLPGYRGNSAIRAPLSAFWLQSGHDCAPTHSVPIRFSERLAVPAGLGLSF